MSDKSNNKTWLMLVVTVVIVFALGYIFIDSNGEQAVAQEQQQTSAKIVADQKEADTNLAPDFTLQNLAGEDVSLSDLRGKVVFVNFWATWCPPCRAEIPHFIELVDKYGDDFTVLGIALDPREFDKVAPFVDKMGINYPVVLDKKGVSQLYGGISSIPTTFVVNRDGEVIEQIVGSRPKEVFEGLVKKAM